MKYLRIVSLFIIASASIMLGDEDPRGSGANADVFGEFECDLAEVDKVVHMEITDQNIKSTTGWDGRDFDKLPLSMGRPCQPRLISLTNSEQPAHGIPH